MSLYDMSSLNFKRLGHTQILSHKQGQPMSPKSLDPVPWQA